LKRNDQFPSERDLSDTFGVSRTTVREPIRTLESIKFLHSRQGNGTYVIVSSEDALIQPLAAVHGRDCRAGDNPGDFGRQIHIRSAPRPAISKARRALSMVSAMLMRRSEGGVDRPLTDSFASYLPAGWTLYSGSMVEPVRRASLTSRHRRLKRLAGSSEPRDLPKGIGGSLPPSPQATAPRRGNTRSVHFENIEGITYSK
jgi:biotin operon repressor